MKKRHIYIFGALLFAFGVFGLGYGTGYGIGGYYKHVAGQASATYSDEVDVNIQKLTPTIVRVMLTSTDDTIEDLVYTVTLFADGLSVGVPGTVSWTLVQIPGVHKNVLFTGLSLSEVADLSVELTYIP